MFAVEIAVCGSEFKFLSKFKKEIAIFRLSLLKCMTKWSQTEILLDLSSFLFLSFFFLFSWEEGLESTLRFLAYYM